MFRLIPPFNVCCFCKFVVLENKKFMDSLLIIWLFRLGLRSLVLESSHGLRVTGFAFITWTNAWRALDAIGVGDYLRQHHNQLYG